jgi:hypothetical protein
MGLDDLRGSIVITRKRLDAEQRELETVRRRKGQAEKINDVETVALAALPVLRLGAQQVSHAPSGRVIVPCDGQIINDIVIYADAPTIRNLQRYPRVAAIARAFHKTTSVDVIRRFLLLSPGDRCSEIRRTESERILRAQPFIADADLLIVDNESGGVDIEVRTIDEAALVLGGSVRAATPHVTSFLFGNANVAGQGVYASANWRDGDGFRDGVGGRLMDHQFIGRPWVVGVEGERASLGASWRFEGAYPFLTDLQRTAWRVRAGSLNGYTELRLPDAGRTGVGLQRGFFDVGGMVRVGLPGRLKLFGLSLTGIDEHAGDRLVHADSGVVLDLGAVPRPYLPRRTVRANALIGVRNISFVRLEGLDALTASQDVPIGFQIGTQLGRSIPLRGMYDEDLFLAGDLYAGATSQMSTVRLQLQAEGRRAIGTGMWDDVLTTGRLTHSWRMTRRQRNQLSLEWSAGHKQRMPFQLLLGVPEGGVRGYEESPYAGGQRLVLRTEQRYARGNFLGTADAGFALFADAGRQWAGDVPFGVTTPVKASVGFSLMATIPPRSARLWRADFAFPVTSGANARWTLSFTNADRTAFVFRSPRDVVEGREVTTPSSIFAWP